MIRAIAPVAALLFGVAILLTGQGLQGVLLPVRANLESFSTIAIGFIGAAYFMGFTWGCWRGPSLIRRAGHVRVFAAMTAVASAGPLLHGLWVNVWTWGVLRFLSGYCFAILYVVIESWLNERATNENRGMIFSAYILINMTVLAVGQQMLLLDDPQNLQLFAIASVLVSLAAVPVLMSTSQVPRDVVDSRFNFKALYRNSPSGMMGSFGSGLANGAFWSLAPVFTAAYTQDVAMAAWFMTAGVLGGATGQWPLGWLSDRVDRRMVLIGIGLASALIGGAMFSLHSQLSMWGILALGYVWGAVAFPVYSISVAHANDWAEPDTFVQISSGLLLMYGVGAVLGPFLASGMMTVVGASGLYAYTALVHSAFTIFVVLRSRRRRQAAPEDHTDFSDALASAMTTSHVWEEEIEREETLETSPTR